MYLVPSISAYILLPNDVRLQPGISIFKELQSPPESFSILKRWEKARKEAEINFHNMYDIENMHTGRVHCLLPFVS